MGIDGVGIGVNALGVCRCPLHSDLKGDLALGVFCFERNDLGVDDVDFLCRVEVFDIVDQTLLVFVRVFSTVGAWPLVHEINTKALIEERHLLESRAQRFIVKIDGLKNGAVRPEGNSCSC